MKKLANHLGAASAITVCYNSFKKNGKRLDALENQGK
jgi:hypothetical protein